AFNTHSILTTRRAHLYVLNRANGNQRVYHYEKVSKQPSYGFAMVSTPSGPPTADEAAVFVPMSKRVTAYILPNFAGADKAKTPDPKDLEGKIKHQQELQPEFLWSYLTTDLMFLQAPLITPGGGDWAGGSRLGLISTDGTFAVLNKFKKQDLFD